MYSLVQQYQQDIDEGRLHFEPAQQSLIEYLDLFYFQLVEYHHNRRARLFGLWRETDRPKGIYLWGDTGRGKTHFLDRVFDALPFAEKKRLHFAQWMLDIHQQLQQLGNSKNPLKKIARRVATDTDILMVDEFHVDDIADAMILAGLLDALFAQGVILMASSNIPLDKLYENGLQRSNFVPAIQLMQRQMQEMNLNSEVDFRLQLIQEQGAYQLVGSEQEGRQQMLKLFEGLSRKQAQSGDMQLNRRPLSYLGRGEQVIVLEFDALCRQPKSSADYIALAAQFRTILLANVPKMSAGEDDVAQRFVQLIDALYDQGARCLMSAFAEPEQLYTGQRLSFVFNRIVSRLMEMRSLDYLGAFSGDNKPHDSIEDN